MRDTDQRTARGGLTRYVVAGVVMVVASVGLSQLVGARDGVERRIVIPAGTAARVAAGEEVDLLPSSYRLRVSDRLVVVNEDVVAHQVGPFRVEPGTTFTRRFSETATYDGFCSLHPAGGLTLDIEPAR